MVGSKFIDLLNEYNTNFENLYLYADKNSAGTLLEVQGLTYEVLELTVENIEKNSCDYALFSAGGDVSIQFASVFVSSGATVIDNSSAFRMTEDVPLVVPEVNPDDAFKNNGIIANPNCSTIQSMLPVKAIDNVSSIRRINYATYQAVSGSGLAGVNELERTSKGEAPLNYEVPIASNVIPQIDVFIESGFTKEEEKMIFETRKILGKDVEVSATCVRVPVINGHSVDIEIQCENDIDLNTIRTSLQNMKGIVYYDDPSNLIYPHPHLSNGLDSVFVGRLRQDLFNPKIVRLFCVADNIRKGAAANTIQIMELLIGGNENV